MYVLMTTRFAFNISFSAHSLTLIFEREKQSMGIEYLSPAAKRVKLMKTTLPSRFPTMRQTMLQRKSDISR
jgi:hypothetical protein